MPKWPVTGYWNLYATVLQGGRYEAGITGQTLELLTHVQLYHTHVSYRIRSAFQ